MNGKKVKSFYRKIGDFAVKVEMWQDGPQAFEVAKWRLGQSIPTIYRFDNFNDASADYSLFIELNSNEPEIAEKLQREIEMLHSLCSSAQCWLDAAAFLAKGHETKCALERNADSFRQAYAKITS